MMYEKGMKIRSEVVFIDEIVYGVEPRFYMDDGCRHIYKFIDEDGNLFVWKTSKSIGIDYVDENDVEGFEFIELGDKIFLSASVKDTTNYKGEDQILLTRCKPVAIEDKRFMSEEELNNLKRKMQLSKLEEGTEIRTISYREYKGSYNSYETVNGSFKRTDNGCFIDVIIPKHDVSNIYYYSE